MSDRHLNDKIDRWVSASLHRHAHGENITFLTGVMQLPPQGVPGYVAALYLPSGVLGSAPLAHLFVMSMPSLVTQESVDDGIRQGVEALLASRTQQLAPTNGGGAARPV
jgi:hypothetical protein